MPGPRPTGRPLPRPRREELRRRLDSDGPDALSAGELLALVLGRGDPPRLERALAEAGGLEGLAAAGPAELAAWIGLGPAAAACFVAALELGRRCLLGRPDARAPLRSPADAARWFGPAMLGLYQEEFHVLVLDARHRVRAHRRVARGSLQSSIVHPREVFRPALRLAGAALVVAHNHPSGDPEPSDEDRAVTDRLRQAGAILGVRLLDHLVLGAGCFYSFAEERTAPLPAGAPASSAVTAAACTTSSTPA